MQQNHLQLLVNWTRVVGRDSKLQLWEEIRLNACETPEFFFWGAGVLGNRTALDMAFLETASCLVFKPQGMITLFQREKKWTGYTLYILVYTYHSRQKNTQLFTIPTNSRTCLGTRVRAEVFFPLTQPGAAAPTPSWEPAGSSRCSAPWAWCAPSGPSEIS